MELGLPCSVALRHLASLPGHRAEQRNVLKGNSRTIMNDDHELGIIRQRIRVLELAEELGNVSEACRRRGISRTQFYVYKRRFQADGIHGLRNRPTAHRSHPDKTHPYLEQLILDLSLSHPSWGCNRLRVHLLDVLDPVSAQTVQNIFRRNGMATRHDRWLKLDVYRSEQEAGLTSEQIEFIEKINPAYRERQTEPSRPGEELSQYVTGVGNPVNGGRIYLHAVVDDFSSYAFGCLHPSKKPDAAVKLLENQVLPFFHNCGVTVERIRTNNGREFCGTDVHPYEHFLSINNIDHVNATKHERHTNGFLQRFTDTLLREFFNEGYWTKFVRSIDDLQNDLDVWLSHYNESRPYLGYPNYGTCPGDRIRQNLPIEVEIPDLLRSGRSTVEVGATPR